MQMKQQNRASSGLELPYGTRYPHLTYGFQSEVLLRPPQYQPTKSDLFFPPLSQVLYKPTPTYHSPRVFLPVLHQGTSPTLQFPVYHEPQVNTRSLLYLSDYAIDWHIPWFDWDIIMIYELTSSMIGLITWSILNIPNLRFPIGTVP